MKPKVNRRLTDREAFWLVMAVAAAVWLLL